MSSLLVTGIGSLVTNDPALGPGSNGVIADAALVVDEGKITWVGLAPEAPLGVERRLDVGGRCVIPGFVDSHAHLVFAGDRSDEFAARMAGSRYGAGGIATTVAATRAADDGSLAANLDRLVNEALRSGTTTIECKTGYGLTTADEARSAALGRERTNEVTFLGAHVVPPEYHDDPDAYVELVCGEMLTACAPHTRHVDVFCERGAFDREQSLAVLRAGKAAGLLPRVHANQLGPGPGVEVAATVGASSADHCTHLSDGDVTMLRDAGVVATLLPGAEFSTRAPYPDARRLLDAGVTVALATDCNPGSSYTTNLGWCVALAVREMGFSPDEALAAATLGGAAALRRDDVGRLAPGYRADLVVLEAPTPVHLAYRPGVDLVARVVKDGEVRR